MRWEMGTSRYESQTEDKVVKSIAHSDDKQRQLWRDANATSLRSAFSTGERQSSCVRGLLLSSAAALRRSVGVLTSPSSAQWSHPLCQLARTHRFSISPAHRHRAKCFNTRGVSGQLLTGCFRTGTQMSARLKKGY